MTSAQSGGRPGGGRPGRTPGVLEEAQVRAMFDRISGFYDRMNSVMTAGLHHGWRRRAVQLAGVSAGDRALDVATGTGDLALALAQAVGPTGEVVASDFSPGMLEHAARKAAAAGLANVRVETANALALPYRDGEFAAATVGFGARNFSDLDQGLREMARVVRPGGRVVVLEITTPTRPPLSSFFALWFDRLVPALGRLAGDAQAYSYLPSSVRRFPGPEELAGRLWAAGLRDVGYVLTAGGIIALHVGTVGSEGPEARASSDAGVSQALAEGAPAEAPAEDAAAAAPADSLHTREGSKTARAGTSGGTSSSTGSFPAVSPSSGASTAGRPVRRGGGSSWGSWSGSRPGTEPASGGPSPSEGPSEPGADAGADVSSGPGADPREEER